MYDNEHGRSGPRHQAPAPARRRLAGSSATPPPHPHHGRRSAGARSDDGRRCRPCRRRPSTATRPPAPATSRSSPCATWSRSRATPSTPASRPTITATRGGKVIGNDRRHRRRRPASSRPTTPAVSAGAPAPTSQVTPDIQAGDEIRVDFLDTGTPWDGSKVARTSRSTGVVLDEAAHKLDHQRPLRPRRRHAGPADLTADPGKFGIEIVNPDMRDGTAPSASARSAGRPRADPPSPTPTGYTVDGTRHRHRRHRRHLRGHLRLPDRRPTSSWPTPASITALGWQADAPGRSASRPSSA